MLTSEPLFDDLAGAVLDGGTVDWAAAESGTDPAVRPLLRGLQLVALVAQVHRHVLPPEGIESSRAPGGTAPPERWGHLRVLERIGRGSFG